MLRYDLFAKSGRLSDSGFPSSVVSEEKLQKQKKVLTRSERCGNLKFVPRLERVPCKLDNEEQRSTRYEVSEKTSSLPEAGLVNYGGRQG